MGDICFFSNPKKPTSSAAPRPSLRRSPKSVRKRHQTQTDMFTQRACMAQHEDPVFCSNHASGLFDPGSFLHSVSASARDTPSPFDLDNDYDDHDDDEIGGVSLPPTDSNKDMSDAPNAVRIAGAFSTATHGIPTYNTTVGRAITHKRPAISAAIDRRPSHPRPTTSDSVEEEDGRRTRFALAGDAEENEPLFDLAAAAAHDFVATTPHIIREVQGHSAQASLQANWTPNPRPVPRRTPHVSGFLFSQVSPPDHPHPAEPAPERGAPRFVIPAAQPNDEVDEDALSVDDPRRHYDLADFMDNWRLRSMSNKRLPAFEPGMQPSVGLGRPSEQVTAKDVDSGAVDMQGLRWSLLGPTRKQATSARQCLHPSGNGHPYYPPTHHQSSFAGEEERHYRFRSFLPKHQARFSHYQLRNVLTASSRNEVFYANGSVVKRASLACPSLSDTVMDLSKPGSNATSFRITCLSASPRSSSCGYTNDSILVAGGFYGEYAILNLDRQDPHSEGFVTHAYNGLVTHIHTYQDRRSGLLQTAFCSNDRKVRLMDLGTQTFRDTFVYENAVNCAATSADGRLRVLVGDCTETIITDAERGTPVVALEDHNDHGFACAWSPDGKNVATGAQDGTVLVWDARNWSQPLRRLDTVMSCARSLNFADNGALIVAENDDVVRVYDAGKCDDWQEIRFFGSIAGIALLDGGAEIAIANADKTVGGLMSFERTGQGVGHGTYRRQGADTGASGRRTRGRAMRNILDMHDVLV